MQLHIIHTLGKYHLQLTMGRTAADLGPSSGQSMISLSPATTSKGELGEENLVYSTTVHMCSPLIIHTY